MPVADPRTPGRFAYPGGPYGLCGLIKPGVGRSVTCSGPCLVVSALLAGGCGGADNGSKPSTSESHRQAPEPTTNGRARTTDARPGRSPRREASLPKAPVLVVPRAPEGPTPSKRWLERQRQREQAERLPQTREAGCERAVFPLAGGRMVWGPPSPRILTARRSGTRIKIGFAFERLPRSPACRPYAITASVVSGKLDTPSFRLSDRRFEVVGPRGSATLRAPSGGRPPYTARVQAWTLDGRPSRQVKAPVM